jgi:iron complex outermembrane receptor protein
LPAFFVDRYTRLAISIHLYVLIVKETLMRASYSLSISCVVALLARVAAAQAQTPPADDEVVFTLGQLTVLGERIADTTGDDQVSADEIWKYNVNTLTDAVKLVPGVTSNFISNGRRNEGDISVRGFDRWRVPLSIDGIRVYLPADNRIDFNRFLTPDLGEIQIRKSFVSVLDGPGAMGGAVNLVTRKPTKAFESEFQLGSSFDRGGEYDGWFGTAIVGTKQDLWYAQASATLLDRDSWSLSKDFQPVIFNAGVTTPPAAQGERERQGSASEDSRINLKAGFTPNETDEYTVSFTKQQGEKEAPLGVDFYLSDGRQNCPTSGNNPQCGGAASAPYQANNFWTWPRWDVQSAYWLSNTQFAGGAYLKTRLSYSEFDNALFAWDDGTYSSQSQGRSFQSYYHDSSFGGSVETGHSFFEGSTTRAAFHWRRDRHREYNFNRPTAPQANTEPRQHNEEKTWSLALEHDWAASSTVDLVAGVSYDKNERTRAEEYGTPTASLSLTCIAGSPPCLYAQPIGDDDAFNWQTALQWRYADNAQLGASISSRSRFPNNFERYSTRFGTAIPNPGLGTERAVHYEINWQATPVEDVRLSAAVFYADIQNMIQTVIVQTAPQQTQTQNVGDGSNHGLELSGDWTIAPQLRVGANYSYLHRKIDNPVPANLKPVGTPDHLGFAYLDWQVLPSLSVRPSIEFAGNRWTDINGSATLSYGRIGRYRLANLQVSWRPLANIEAVLGARNLFDKNFELAHNLPEPGRSLYTKVRISF